MESDKYADTEWYKVAERMYDKDTFMHAKRVSEYAVDIGTKIFWINDEEEIEALYQTGIFHDIVEDTDFEFTKRNCYRYNIHLSVYYAVLTLTNKSDSYDEYCRKIRDSGDKLAYIVKLADMKDHLSLKETLTERLKNKYVSGLAELL